MNKISVVMGFIASVLIGAGLNHLVFHMSPATFDNQASSTNASQKICQLDEVQSQEVATALAAALRQTIKDSIREEAVAVMLEATLNPPVLTAGENESLHNAEQIAAHQTPGLDRHHSPPGNEMQKKQQRLASENFRQLVNTSIAKAQWNEEDNDQLRMLLGSADKKTEQQLMTRLAAAINNGDMDVNFDGPLF